MVSGAYVFGWKHGLTCLIWCRTTLAHAVAASIVLLLEIMHGADAIDASSQELLHLVLQAIEVFRTVKQHSHIADKGLEMLTALVEGYRRRNEPRLQDPRIARTTSFSDRSRAEMDNALQVLGSSREEALRRRGSASERSLKSPQKELVTPPAFIQPVDQFKVTPMAAQVGQQEDSSGFALALANVQSPFQWLAAAPLPITQSMDMTAESFAIPEFGGMDGFYDWDIGLSWMDDEIAQPQ